MDPWDLMSYLEGKTCAGRKEKPVYFEDGDFVTFYCADDMAHEQRIDELVTIYRSFKTGEMVGCKIKGVKRILSRIGDFGIIIHDHGSLLTLGMLFLGAAAFANPTQQKEYEDLGRRFGSVPFEAPVATAA